MWTFVLIGAVLGFIIGVIAGYRVARSMQGKESVGTLRVDHSIKDEPPYLFLELHEDIPRFVDRPYVLLEVRRKDFFPQ